MSIPSLMKTCTLFVLSHNTLEELGKTEVGEILMNELKGVRTARENFVIEEKTNRYVYRTNSNKHLHRIVVLITACGVVISAYKKSEDKTPNRTLTLCLEKANCSCSTKTIESKFSKAITVGNSGDIKTKTAAALFNLIIMEPAISSIYWHLQISGYPDYLSRQPPYIKTSSLDEESQKESLFADLRRHRASCAIQ